MGLLKNPNISHCERSEAICLYGTKQVTDCRVAFWAPRNDFFNKP